MRPRLFAAEIQKRFSCLFPYVGCFNEAAAFRRGNQRSSSDQWRSISCFNEAAAFRRGNPPLALARSTAFFSMLQ